MLPKLYNCQELCLSTVERINKLWHTHIMEYNYNKRNKLLIHAITWMNFKVLYRVKETSLKGYTLYDSIYTSDGEFISGCQRIEVKEGVTIKG